MDPIASLFGIVSGCKQCNNILSLRLFYWQDELEITSRRLGGQGGYNGTHVLIRNKTTGEVVAEGRHSLFSIPASKM